MAGPLNDGAGSGEPLTTILRIMEPGAATLQDSGPLAAGQTAPANGAAVSVGDGPAAGAVVSNGAAASPTVGGFRKVLVLNASYEPINVCSMRRAVVLVLKRKAEVLERGGVPLRSERTSLERPAVIRLVTYVRVPRDAHSRRITRKAVLARDSWTCQYCGDRKPGMTIDHVVPRSRGGESIWENIVAACGGCNRRKGNRLPHEIQMHPRSRPRPPAPTVFITIASPRIPTSWHAYIPAAA